MPDRMAATASNAEAWTIKKILEYLRILLTRDLFLRTDKTYRTIEITAAKKAIQTNVFPKSPGTRCSPIYCMIICKLVIPLQKYVFHKCQGFSVNLAVK